MGVHFVRPRVCDLVFHLYGRPLHPELFDILKVHRVQNRDFDLTVRLTRTGHVISWDNRNVHLTEVAAAGDEPLPHKRRLLSHPLKGERTATLACAHGVRYQTSFQVEVLPPEIFLHVHDEIVVDGARRGLVHHLPAHHRLSPSPLTFVSAESRAGCLFVSSFHTFPEETTVVKTQSLIEHG
jgi:hypothetical protein